MSLFRFPACALVASLGACASYSARPLDPAEELARLAARDPAALRIEYVRGASPGAAPQELFDARDGLDEAELAALALAASPELGAQRAAIGEAKALLVSAGLLPDPELGAFVRTGAGGSSGTALGLDALLRLPRPDERASRRALAGSEVERSRAELAALELALVARVRHARLALLAAEQSLRLHERELALRVQAVALVRRQRELGEATELSLALFELERTAVERTVRARRSAVAGERRALNELLGLPPAFELTLAGSGAGLVFTLVAEPSDAEIDARLQDAPELRARAADYRRAEAELRLAVARQYPGIALGPSYERDLEGGASLGLGLALELPLFDRNRGEILAKQAQRARTRASYVAALHGLRARAHAARAELQRARSEVELGEREVVPLAERTQALFEGALRAREGTVFEWLAAQSRVNQARQDLLEALASYAGAAVDLDAALGSPLVAVVHADVGDPSHRPDR